MVCCEMISRPRVRAISAIRSGERLVPSCITTSFEAKRVSVSGGRPLGSTPNPGDGMLVNDGRPALFGLLVALGGAPPGALPDPPLDPPAPGALPLGPLPGPVSGGPCRLMPSPAGGGLVGPVPTSCAVTAS